MKINKKNNVKQMKQNLKINESGGLKDVNNEHYANNNVLIACIL